MDVLGKKTPGEREDEEANRLVRPLPKKKPPRHDKRRERMEVDRDTDIDDDPDLKGDKDLSMNYKTIGGSGLSRVIKLANAADRIKVRRKEDGKVVEVSKDTLRERGGEYEKYESQGQWEQEIQDLHQRMQDDPGLSNRLKSMLNPSSDLGGLAKGNPSFPAAPFEKNLPSNIKTLGDLLEVAEKAFAYKPPASKKSPKKPEKVQQELETKAPEPSKKEPQPATKAPQTKGLPGLTPQVQSVIKKLVELMPQAEPNGRQPEETTQTEPPASSDNQEVPASEQKNPDTKKPKKPKSEKDKEPSEKDSPEKAVQRRVPTASEVAETRQLVVDTFPPKMAGRFINLHPDDIRNLVSNFNEFKALGPIAPGDVEKELAKAGKVTLDPEKITPPETVTKEGKEVKLSDLSPEERLEAIQQHRTALIGAQLAIRVRAISSMRKSGTSPKMAQKLTDFYLNTNGLSPEERMKKAQENARDLFVQATSDDSLVEQDDRFGVPKSKGSQESSTLANLRKKALSSIQDPAAKALLVSAYQGEDYRKMMSEHFGTQAKEPITDAMPAKVIAEKIKNAEEFFKNRARQYPEEVRAGLDDPAALFRVRVRQVIMDLDPKKAKKLARFLAESEAKSYEDAKEAYFKALKDYHERLREWKYSGSESPAPIEPKKPIKPVSYDTVRGIKDSKGTQTKLDALLGVKKAYSSYPLPEWQKVLARLGGDQQDQNGSRGHAAASQAEETMTIKFATQDAEIILTRLDKMASTIQENHAKWGMDFATAKGLVNDLDRTADEIEKAAFGEKSLHERQVEVFKSAKVIQHDSDEGYMATFNAPMAPKQTDADEKYMSQFKDDQSTAVSTGKSETGRPLAK